MFAGAIADVTDKKLIKKTASYVTTDLEGLHKDNSIEGSIINVSPSALSELIDMINEGELSSRGAKDTLLELYKTVISNPFEMFAELGRYKS